MQKGQRADRINVDALGSSSLRQLREDIAQRGYEPQLRHLWCICMQCHHKQMRHQQVCILSVV